MHDLRKYADLVSTLIEAVAPVEVPRKRRRFIGTSHSCFDGSRFDCLEGRLPWSVWHDLQAAMADAEEVCQADFFSANGAPKDVVAAIKGHPARYLVCNDGAAIPHDAQSNIHYFFI